MTVSPGVVNDPGALQISNCPLKGNGSLVNPSCNCVIDAISYEFVGEAVAVTNPEPVAVEATENVVSVGAGTPRTENVYVSSFELPVPAIVYKEPTTGVNAGVNSVNVKVMMPGEGLEYAVTANTDPPLLLEMVKIGGAPGPH